MSNNGTPNDPLDIPQHPKRTKPTATNSSQEGEARFARLVENVMSMRGEIFGRLLDPRRNIYDECGYPSGPISSQSYQDLYDRESIAARVVELLPKESWQTTPLVYEEEEGDNETEFELAWDELGSQLRGENSWYEDEEGSAVWEYLKRVDILSGIGQYGILLIGLDDGKELREPVKGKKGMKLLYLRCFPESMAQISAYDNDPKSPRFGHPERYLITFNDWRDSTGGTGAPIITQEVHWSRVIHVVDNLTSSEVFGVPRMRAVLNNLLGLQKLYAGSAEMYWRGAFPGISLETHPALGGDVELDVSGIRDTMENYANGLQRYLAIAGVAAKTLAPQVVDPTPQINTQIEAICIKIGCPIRVFKGSERGELASSQDDAAWNDRLRERQRGYLTPRVIIPFVDRLISVGVLPQPKQYHVEWPDLASQNELEVADVAGKKTAALGAYISGGVEALMPPFDFLTRIMKFTEEEAEVMIEESEKLVEEKEAADLEKQEEKIDKGLVPDPTNPPPPPNAPPGSPPGKVPPGKAPPGKEVANTENVFCATGEGGGIDPSCSPGGSGSSKILTDDATRTLAKKLIGKDVSDDDWAKLATAPPGSTVSVSSSGGKITISATRKGEDGVPDFDSLRTISKPWFGSVTCENKQIVTRGKAKGTGADLFADQVKTLDKLGIGTIVTSAAGSPEGGGNGYVTWPKLGYSGPMSSKQIEKLPKEFKEKLGKKKDVADLISLPGGGEAWAKFGSSIKLTFDTKEGSKNRKALDNYLANRKPKSQSKQ